MDVILCDYGCGNTGIVFFKNGKKCCSDRSDRCPAIIQKRVKTRKSRGHWHSEETKKNIGKSIKGRILTDEWKHRIGKSLHGKEVSDETREKLRVQKLGEKNPNFGKQVWNCGLTHDIDNRVLSYSLKQKNVPCPKRSHPNKNKGKKKQESLDIVERIDPAYRDFKKYRNRVSVRTKKTYEMFKKELNPDNLPLGKCGVQGAHQIDHIISVRIGFENNISIEEISSKNNLRIIPWLENLKKYDGKNSKK